MSEALKPLRNEIDQLDRQIVDLLAQRADIVRRVVKVKNEHNIPVVIPERINEVLDHVAGSAADKNLSPDVARAIYKILIDYACAMEKDILGRE